MQKLLRLLEFWYVKLAVSVITAFVAPFKISFIVLIILIILDTVTGSYYAMRINRFTSRGFKKVLVKFLTYTTLIFIVRLLELGISEIFKTSLLTLLVTSYLIITEVISVLENFTLLGAPVPGKLSKLLMKGVLGGNIKDVVKEGAEFQHYIEEISDMIDFQIPSVASLDMQKLLEVKFSEWLQLIAILDTQFTNSGNVSGELLYYRIDNLMDITNAKISERWLESGVSPLCINKFKSWHEPILEKMKVDIRSICFSNETAEKKEVLIIEKVIISLYKTLADVQKGEICSNRHGYEYI